VSDNSSSGGFGCCTALFIVFITMKLTGYITWSWWWVTAPLWGPVVLLLGFLALCAAGAGIFGGGARP